MKIYAENPEPKFKELHIVIQSELEARVIVGKLAPTEGISDEALLRQLNKEGEIKISDVTNTLDDLCDEIRSHIEDQEK